MLASLCPEGVTCANLRKRGTDVMDASYVFYRRQDYAGLGRRLISGAIDLCVLLLMAVVVFILIKLFRSPSIGWLWGLLAYLYLTVVKRSVGTLGYLVTGVRIVDLKGKRPGLLPLSLRLVWWTLGPVNAFIDLVYLTGDENRQTIRDKMLQTYVIKKAAQPLGTGPRRAVCMNFMTLSLLVFEVDRASAPAPSPTPPPA